MILSLLTAVGICFFLADETAPEKAYSDVCAGFGVGKGVMVLREVISAGGSHGLKFVVADVGKQFLRPMVGAVKHKFVVRYVEEVEQTF